MIAAGQGADAAVVLLDREQQDACPGRIARDIAAALMRACAVLPAYVVLKNRCFENWLVADLGALLAQPSRFEVTSAMRKKVEPNKADQCDAIALLKKSVIEDQYEKVRDSVRICSKMDVAVAARHSRSFRHLLHVLEDPAYLSQCRLP